MISEDSYSPVAIGRRLAHARVRAQLLPDEAAKLAMMAPKSLGAWERGASGDPPDHLLAMLGSLYGTHPAVLRYGADVLDEARRMERAAERGDPVETPVTSLVNARTPRS
ncbi:MAG: helix-turn-helix transcriptional regulator [Gemmatimonadota bacterium]